MQMVSSGKSSVSGSPDGFLSFYLLLFLDINRGKVAVKGHKPVAMVNHYIITVDSEEFRHDNHSVIGRGDWRRTNCRKVITQVVLVIDVATLIDLSPPIREGRHDLSIRKRKKGTRPEKLHL